VLLVRLSSFSSESREGNIDSASSFSLLRKKTPASLLSSSLLTRPRPRPRRPSAPTHLRCPHLPVLSLSLSPLPLPLPSGGRRRSGRQSGGHAARRPPGSRPPPSTVPCGVASQRRGFIVSVACDAFWINFEQYSPFNINCIFILARNL
jgi:hypothetical protein